MCIRDSLYSKDEYWNELRSTLGGDIKINLWLAPPLFAKKDPITGEMIKQKYGSSMFAFFKIMKNFKFLRGSALDIFGYSEERKTERALIAQYIEDIDVLMSALNKDNFELALKIAQIPQEIRGYGHVKEKSVVKCAKLRETLLKQFKTK